MAFNRALFKSDYFNFVKEENGKYIYEWNLSEEEKQMFKDFGDKAVILPEDFVQKVVKKAEGAGNAAFIKEVQYIDYDVVDEKRKRSFDNQEIDFFFWKDKNFKSQREVRIILPGQLVENHLKYYVPELDGGSNIVDTENLFNKLMISIEKKK
ncbi:hypothetical protein [Salimicrobium flavidum]|nr:hypothetical protein [Salimicrobium flavidum]